MSAIKLTILGTGTGRCALTNKEAADGLTIAFENEPQTFVSWKAFRMLLSYRTTKPELKAAVPVNGPAAAVK